MATVVASGIPDCSIKPLPAPSVYAYEANNGNYRALFKASLGEVDTVRFESHGGHICWQPTEFAFQDADQNLDPIVVPSDVPIAVEGNVARYDRSSPDIDEQWTVEEARLKHVWVLRQPLRSPAPWIQLASAYLSCGGYLEVAADHKLFVGGQEMLGSFETAGAIEIRNAAGELVMTLARVAVQDAAGQATSGKYRVTVQPDGSRLLSVLVDYGWLSVATYPVEIDPTTVTTSTSSNATASSNQRKVVRASNGNLVAFYYDGTNIAYKVSSDGGQTWSAGATVSALGPGWYSVDIDSGDNIHLVYTNPSLLVVYRRGTPDAGRTSWTFTSEYNVGPSVSRFADLVVHAEGSDWRVHVVYSLEWSTSDFRTVYNRIDVTSGGAITINASVTLDDLLSLYTYPSISIGGASGKDLYIVWTTDGTGTGKGIRFKKATYSAGSWTWGDEEAITEAVYANQMGPCSLDSAGRLLVTFRDPYAYLRVFRRAADGTWSDISPATQVGENPTLTVNTVTDDAYLFYKDGGMKYQIYSGGIWGTAVTVDISTSANYPSLRRNTGGSAVDVLYTEGGASPYNVKHHRITLNVAPSAPTNLAPGGGSAFDATASQNFTWQFNDSDPGDGQSAYQIKVYDNSTGALVLDTGKVASTTSSHTFAANTFTNGVEYKWEVFTWDKSDVVSPSSGFAIFKTSAKPTVTITSPTAGQVLTGATVTVGWSVSDPESKGQSQYQVKLYNSDRSATLADTGVVVDANARARTVNYTLANNTTYQVGVTAWDGDGVASTEVYVTFSVSFTPPPNPTFTLATDANNVRITVTITNPAPGVGVPDTSSNKVYRRKLGESSWRLMAEGVAKNGSWADYSPASGQAYEYGVAPVGDNGVEGSIVSAQATVTFDGWWLVDEANPTNNVKFRYNVDQVPVGVDEARAEFKTFGKYPIVQYGAGRAKRGTLSGLVVDETTTAKDQADKVDALAALRKSLLLKGWRGHIWRVNIHNLSRNIVRDLVIKSEQVQVAWVEVGDV